MDKIRYIIIIVLGLLSAVATSAKTPPDRGNNEVYIQRFLNGDDGWNPMSILQRNSELFRSKAEWKANPADSLLSGLNFRMNHAQEGDFLFVYKLFGGLQPTSIYRLSFLSSFTVQDENTQDEARDAKVHLKIGSTDLRPKTLYNRGNFSKGTGPESGRNLAWLGDMKWREGDSTHRYIAHNYDEPVYAVTNKDGNLYVILGLEKGAGTGYMPPVYLNTLRITFDYAGKDSLEMKRAFRVETTETEEKNVYSYEVHPVQEVIRYSIFTKDGHLIMVEEDSDCVPTCPNTIDASFLDPDRYWLEFILLNEKRIVQPLVVHP